MSATLEVVSDPAKYKLNATDRCDRCGSQAYVEVIFPSGALLLCGHHHHQHHSALAERALTVRDETSQIPSV